MSQPRRDRCRSWDAWVLRAPNQPSGDTFCCVQRAYWSPDGHFVWVRRQVGTPDIAICCSRPPEAQSCTSSAGPPRRRLPESTPLPRQQSRAAPSIAAAPVAAPGPAAPALVAAMPLLVVAIRAVRTHGIWFWGDQALIDLEARDSLLGRNLLGVYDRYGWHHLGPMWLLVLGVSRWLGGGSPEALIVGSCVLQAVTAAAIVVVAARLRPGLTAWWAALVLLGCEWSLGLDRLGTVWAPYSIALPSALFVLLIAHVVVSPKPWAPTVVAAVCGSFLLQTDISTIVIVGVLALATPLLRLATRARLRPSTGPNDGRPGTGRDASRPSNGADTGRRWGLQPGWGWSAGNWRAGAASLVAVVVVLWLPPGIEQLTTSPGNVVQVYRFVSTHPSDQTLETSLEAAGTVFGSFPLRIGERSGARDSDPAWLVKRPIWERPWYLAYILLTIGAAALAVLRRQRQALALAATSCIAILAAGWSVGLIYGALYPYLVFWTGALVVPAWVACWLALAPAPRPVPGRRASAFLGFAARNRWSRLTVPLASLAAAATVSTAFVVYPFPMTGATSALGRRSWQAVSAGVLAPRVKVLYIDMASPDAMPEAAAIADQAVRRGRRVEVNRAALYFLDPSFAQTAKAQVRVFVCCGRPDPGQPPRGLWFSARVGGQAIYTSARPERSAPSGPSKFGEPPVRYAEVVGDLVNNSPGHHPDQFRLGVGQSADRPAEDGDPVRHGPSIGGPSLQVDPLVKT